MLPQRVRHGRAEPDDSLRQHQILEEDDSGDIFFNYFLEKLDRSEILITK